jgi:hypothetical protein
MTGHFAHRLLYVPNEVELGQQRGPRRVFESLMDEGALEAYKAFALPYEFTARGSTARALDDLATMATDLQPTLVLWQHIMNSPIPASFHRFIRNLESQPLIAFQDIDPYGWADRPTSSTSVDSGRSRGSFGLVGHNGCATRHTAMTPSALPCHGSRRPTVRLMSS